MKVKMINANPNVIEHIYFNSDWQKILKQRNNIRIPTDNPLNLDSYVHDQPDSVWEIIDRDGIIVHANDSYLEKIQTDSSAILDYPSDIYLLDQGTKDSYLKDNTGVFVSTDQSATAEPLKINWQMPLNAGEPFSWESFFENDVVNDDIPSNSLIIVDRYLLNAFSRGKFNFISILNSILPKTLNGVYHILLVVEEAPSLKDKQHCFKSIDEVIASMNSVVPSLKRPYEIVFEVLVINKAEEWNTPDGKAHYDFYNATHSRRIYSNYFIIGADQGFCAVRKVDDCNVSFFTQKVEFNALYYGIDNKYQNANFLPFKTLDNFLAVISRFVQSEKPICKYYKNGVSGNVHDIVNRLLG